MTEKDIRSIERDVDKGISRYVGIFLRNGIETCQSCEGGPGHAYPEPTIDCYGGIGSGWAILKVCLDFDLPIMTLCLFWDITDGLPTGPAWRAIFKTKMPVNKKDWWNAERARAFSEIILPGTMIVKPIVPANHGGRK
jgi:hypothetical protein